MGNLQQEVISLPARMAVGVFQVQAAVLLRVKSLILRAPALPPSFRCHLHHGRRADLQGCQPRPLSLPSSLVSLFTNDRIEAPLAAGAVRVAQAVDPAIDLPNPP